MQKKAKEEAAEAERKALKEAEAAKVAEKKKQLDAANNAAGGLDDEITRIKKLLDKTGEGAPNNQEKYKLGNTLEQLKA